MFFFPLKPQIFKIVAPFVFLSAAFATLNARLGMPPFAFFLVALCLTDGARVALSKRESRTHVPLTTPFILSSPHTVMTMTFFFSVTDTGKFRRDPTNPFSRAPVLVLSQRPSTKTLTFLFFFILFFLFKGSWLQIGQSISHFCITSLLLVFSAGIASVGEALMRGSVVSGYYQHHPKKVDSDSDSGGGSTVDG